MIIIHNLHFIPSHISVENGKLQSDYFDFESLDFYFLNGMKNMPDRQFWFCVIHRLYAEVDEFTSSPERA